MGFRINKEIAKKLQKTFEVIMGRGFDKDALKILKKRNLRIIDISKFRLKNIRKKF